MNLLSDVAMSHEERDQKEVPPGRILIVTSCTKEKAPTSLSPTQQLTAEQLWDDGSGDRTTRAFGELDAHRMPAGKLYRGRQHLQLMQGVEQLRRVFGEEVVDVKIVSAGFGLVDEKQLLPPYNATFAELSATRITSIAKKLCIPQAISRLVETDYTCAFFLLGENYLLSLGLPFTTVPLFSLFISLWTVGSPKDTKRKALQFCTCRPG